MATQTTDVRSLPFSRVTLATPFSIAPSFPIKPLSTFRKARRARIELEALSDRELADLGIARNEIRAFVAREMRNGDL